jgi:hypothetical protein
MSGVTVTFPPLEAMALDKRLSGRGGMTAAECDAAQRAHQRVASALTKEVGSYESGIETIAESLIGEEVSLKTTYGKTFTGRLDRLSGFRTVIIADEPFSHPINLSLVESIEPVRSEVPA